MAFSCWLSAAVSLARRGFLELETAAWAVRVFCGGELFEVSCSAPSMKAHGCIFTECAALWGVLGETRALAGMEIWGYRHQGRVMKVLREHTLECVMRCP